MKSLNMTLIVLSILFIAFPCIAQGELINRYKGDNYNIIFQESFESFKNRIDTTKANADKIIYTKKDNDYFGIIYNKKNASRDFFIENTKENMLYYYTLNPFLDYNLEAVAYDVIVSNLYECFFINFNRNEIIEYNVFLRLNNFATFYSRNKDMCSIYSLTLKSKPIIHDFKSLKGIKEFQSKICLKYIRKRLIRQGKVRNVKPLMLVFILNFLELKGKGNVSDVLVEPR